MNVFFLPPNNVDDLNQFASVLCDLNRVSESPEFVDHERVRTPKVPQNLTLASKQTLGASFISQVGSGDCDLRIFEV
jgi:hypothetical protein